MTTALSGNEFGSLSGSEGGSVPRFRKIVEAIREQIDSGQLTEHAALPSERGIARKYGVSRMTARRALEALELKGLVYSEDRRGRFVSPQRLSYDVNNKISFIKDARSRNNDIEIEVIAATESEADSEIAGKLAIDSGEPVYQYTRLFRSKGHAVFIETEYLVAQAFPGFLEYDLRQSTTQIMESRFNRFARTGDIVIRMRGVNADEARLLGLTGSQSGIELEQVISDTNGTAFCFGRQLWRGELAEFSARAIVNVENPV